MSILDDIDGLAQSVADSAVWHSSGILLADVETENQCNAPTDYIYELYCLLRIVKDLAKKHTVRLIFGFGKNRIKFPRKPANKIGWPRYHIFEKATDSLLMQVCAGTKISNPTANVERAPDISFQKPEATESPTSRDILCIYDAKFNEGKHKKTLSEAEYAKVAMMVRELDLEKSFPIDLPVRFSHLRGFEANCILTNGAPMDQNHQRHRHHFLRVVFDFDQEKQHFGIVG